MKKTIQLMCSDRGQHRDWIYQSWIVEPETVTAELMMRPLPMLSDHYVEYRCGWEAANVATASTNRPFKGGEDPRGGRRHCNAKPRIRVANFYRLCEYAIAKARMVPELRVAVDLSHPKLIQLLASGEARNA